MLPHEYFVAETSSVWHRGDAEPPGFHLDKLLLTSENLVFVYKKRGMFRERTDVRVLPLNQVKVRDGEAQLITGSTKDKRRHLKIVTQSGEIDLTFGNPKEAKYWAGKINEEITGEPAPMAEEDFGFVASAASAVQEAKNALWSAFGKRPGTEPSRKTTSKCAGCGAAVQGMQGAMVTCDYCDSANQL